MAAGEDVEGDVQHVVGLVIGQVAFEQVEVLIDVGDQAGRCATRSMAPMPPAASPWTRSASS